MKVIIIAAITADGFIAKDSHHPADWTSSADKKIFVKLTKELGIMVMGSNTFRTIGRALPGRRTIVYTNDTALTAREDIETTVEAPATLINRLRDSGAVGVAICGGASIYTQFMEAGVVDELYLTVEPVLFGDGLPLFSKTINRQLSLYQVNHLSDDVVQLHYLVK